MSHRACLALSTLLLTLACSSAKPPESSTPELTEAAATDPQPTEPATTKPATTPADDAPAAPGSPSSADPASPVAPSPAPAIETLFVRDRRAACEGEGKRECLQVRSTASEPWRNLFASIEGFEYEPSYAYELKVEVSRVVNPPQDAAALKYRLVEVVSKRKPAP